MIHEVFTVRDAKAEFFSPPFYHANREVALRMFKDVVNNKETRLYNNPEDYDLYYLGQWDDNSGKYLSLLDSPEHLVKATQLKRSPSVTDV